MNQTTIISTGSCIPTKRECNSQLADELGLQTDWIIDRTGISSRSIADPTVPLSDLAIQAGQDSISKSKSSGYEVSDIGTLILATSTPDYLLPPTAPSVAFQLGLGKVPAMDLTVACSGFLYALILADAICKTSAKGVIVIAANVLSRRCKRSDPATRPIFADAAGAIILGPSSDVNSVISTAWESDGSAPQAMLIPDGGSRSPFNEHTFREERHLMDLKNGSAVFKYAVQTMARLGKQVIDDSGLSIDEIDWWIPHQANQRIIDASRRILGVEQQKTLTTVADLGNSSAATIPVTLDHFRCREKKINSGDTVLMTAAAVGMTGAAVVVRMP